MLLKKEGGGKFILVSCENEQDIDRQMVCKKRYSNITTREAKIMKKLMVICFVMFFGLFMASGALAEGHRNAIKAHVDSVVEGINGGKAPTDYKAEDFEPYIFIMEEDGTLLVHPTLQDQSLGEEKYAPVYDALIQATAEGVWVQYEWGGSMKNSYVRKTEDGLIVGSGY